MTSIQASSGRKVFYGWKVLGVSVAGAFLAATTSQLFMGAMLPDIQDGTGWSRSSITLGVTLGSMTAGFVAPFFGRLADLYGSRILSSIGAVVSAAGLCLIALSATAGILVFYAGFIVARASSANMLSGVVPRTTIVNWFRRRRGRALGLLSMAIPLGGAALVPIAKLVSDLYGWSTVFYAVGVAMLLLLPVLALVLRRRPEDLGLQPDGDETPAVSAELQPAARDPDDDWSLRQAMRTPPFWLLIGALTCGTFANGGVGFHQAAYFEDQGVSTAAVALAISTYAISGAFANGLWGFLVEYVSERLLGALTLFSAALLQLFLLTVASPVGAVLFAVGFGLSARGQQSIIVVMQAKYFGRGSFGAISGFSTPFQQISLGLGPIVAALIYDASGASYTIAFLLFGVMFAIAASLVWLAKQPSLPPEGGSVA